MAMQVRDGMNQIVVTIGPGHTLSEAVRRMAEHNVGAAVVFDLDQHGPRIFTERDLLRASVDGKHIDIDLVSDHLSPHLTYAHAHWPLETASEQMVRGAF